MRVTLGIPVVVTMTHPLVAGPVTNTLFHDFQRFPSQSSSNGYAHVGAPSATLECKLLGVEDDVVKSGVYEGEVRTFSIIWPSNTNTNSVSFGALACY